MKRLALIAALIGAAFAATPQSQTALPTTRVTAASFEYVGAFRLPGQNGTAVTRNPDMRGEINSFNGGGGAMALSPDGRGLILTGSACCQDPADAGPSTVAEIAIPEIRNVATIGGLATASYRQGHVDILRSKQREVGCGGPIGGLLPSAGRLIVSVYCYYDAGYVQNRSHFVSGLTFASLPTVAGPIEVQSPASGGGRAGFVSGYMGTIPAEWQAAFGGDTLVGQCCIPIITRTSWGPAASVVRAADFGVREPVPAVNVLSYPTGHPLDGDASCEADGELFNCNTAISSVVFVPGTSSVLFFGTQGTGPNCYGHGTSNKALHGTPHPESELWCYDPAAGSKGGHAYPYRMQVWEYDANDLVRVKNGQLQPWQVRPRSIIPLSTPFGQARQGVGGVAYDAATRLVYIVAQEQDAPKPLIQVFRLNVPTLPPVVTPPPPPPPAATDAVVSVWSAWTGDAWSPCVSGTQSRTETRTRTVVTPAANGGSTPPLSETRTAAQSCTVTPPPVEPPPPPPPAPNVIQVPGTIRSIARNTREVCTTSWFGRKTCRTEPVNEWTITVQAGANTVRILVAVEPVGLKAGDGWDTTVTVR